MPGDRWIEVPHQHVSSIALPTFHIHRLLPRLLDGLHGVVTGAAVPAAFQWLGNTCQGKIDLSLYIYHIKNEHTVS